MQELQPRRRLPDAPPAAALRPIPHDLGSVTPVARDRFGHEQQTLDECFTRGREAVGEAETSQQAAASGNARVKR